jgi:hypothetical protein
MTNKTIIKKIKKFLYFDDTKDIRNGKTVYAAMEETVIEPLHCPLTPEEGTCIPQ